MHHGCEGRSSASGGSTYGAGYGCPQYESPARVAVEVDRSDDRIEFLLGEIVGRDLAGLDLAQSQGRNLADVIAAEASPEKSFEALLFLRADNGSFGPCAAEREQSIEVELIEILEALDPGPVEELLLKILSSLLMESGFSSRLRASVM